MGTIFDITNIGDDFGKYTPIDDIVAIFLGTIYHNFKTSNSISENKLLADIIDTIIHEEIHRALDECLDDPNDGDDHTVFRYLVN
jgi:hypothetical protein